VNHDRAQVILTCSHLHFIFKHQLDEPRPFYSLTWKTCRQSSQGDDPSIRVGVAILDKEQESKRCHVLVARKPDILGFFLTDPHVARLKPFEIL
jgi:hypothetical protein